MPSNETTSTRSSSSLDGGSPSARLTDNTIKLGSSKAQHNLKRKRTVEQSTTAKEAGICVRVFRSRIFTLLVGPQREEYTAHESTLTMSPVLARMCQSPFREGLCGILELPEDNCEDFAIFLKYLYSSGKYLNLSTQKSSNSDFTHRMAGLYILADKYDVQPLQAKIIAKLRKIPLWEGPGNREMWLRAMHKIYQNTPEPKDSRVLGNRDQFHKYFQECLEGVLDELYIMHEEGESFETTLDEFIREGGQFAVDLMWAQRQIIRQYIQQ